MTPLAKLLLNDYFEVRGRDRPARLVNLQKKLLQARQFEVTQIEAAVKLLCRADLDGAAFDEDGQPIEDQGFDTRIDKRLVFLPAPVTWVEWLTPERRKGVLLEQQDKQAYCTPWVTDGPDILQMPPLVLPLAYEQDAPANGHFVQAPLETELKRAFEEDPEKAKEIIAALPEGMTPVPLTPFDLAMQRSMLFAILAVINTPRVFARRERAISFTEQRKLKAAAAKAGCAYQLLPWTEIVLEITPPALDGEPSAPGRPGGTKLTGGKALHLCKMHMRVRLGRIEWVRAHWRGDPARGIKQSYYTVKLHKPETEPTETA
jgi:hypothetical protein